MKNLIISLSLVLGLSMLITEKSFAVCSLAGNTPDGGNIINCPAPVQNAAINLLSNPMTTDMGDEVNVPSGGGIEVPFPEALNTADGDDVVNSSGDLSSINDEAIETGSGNDKVTIDGGNLFGGDDCISTSGGDDMVTVNAGALVGDGSQAINAGSGNNMVIVNGGTIRSLTGQAIFTSNDDDTVTFNGGTFITDESDEILTSRGGNDTVIINGGTFQANNDEIIDLGDENDSLTFGANVDLGGFVNCGNGFDTLVFAMGVQPELLPIFSGRIAAASLPDGDVTIEGILYSWTNCELLVNELVGERNVRPIPTLSEWGLITMAGLLGIVGFIAVQRRKASA